MKEKLLQVIKKSKKNEKGFTLIEMIVVIAIIGVLAAILVPTMSGYISDAQTSKKEANARTFYTAAQASVTSAMASGKSVVAGTISKPATLPAADTLTFGEAVQVKVNELMGSGAMEKIHAYEINVDANGSVTSILIKEDATDTGTQHPKTTS